MTAGGAVGRRLADPTGGKWLDGHASIAHRFPVRPRTRAKTSSRAKRRPGAAMTTPAEPIEPPSVGAALRAARLDRGLSLEALAGASGVSRAMLGQIELGHSVPTITVLWKVAKALGVPIAVLLGGEKKLALTHLPRSRARLLSTQGGAMSSRALFPLDEARTVEFYELRVKRWSRQEFPAHAAGTTEHLAVAAGTLELTVGGEQCVLATGDAAVYQADMPHAYRNMGNAEALLYVVIGYA
jgi:transcriptional regulator with XRE-family HTH domain